MLQLTNISINMLRDNKTIIEGLNLVVNDGEKAALIGEEGNGKSTLLRWIMDPKSVKDYAHVTGSVYTGNAKCGYLPQELPIALRAKAVYDYMCDACVIDEKTPREVSRICRQLGLEMETLYSQQSMGTLSGGERIKLQLAGLLLDGCDTLLLDEPSNDIDIPTLEWLEKFMLESKATVLYISHDEVLLERTAELIIHVEQVRRKTIPRVTVARQPYRKYMDERAARMEKTEQISRFEHVEFKKKKQRYLSIYQAVESAQGSITRQDPSTGRLLKKKMHSVKSLGKRLDKEEEELTAMPEAEWAILPKFDEGIELINGKVVLDLSINELRVSERLLARNIQLNVTGPEHICIIGKNGCGKTTLLKQIAETLLPRRDINAAYMPQSYDDMLNPSLFPVEYLAPNGDKDSVTRARIYLGSMKYTTDEMSHKISELSGGQRAKLLLLNMILNDANVLILDEPTRNFSPLSAPAVRELLANFPGAIISASHDRRYIGAIATAVYELTQNGLRRIDFSL